MWTALALAACTPPTSFGLLTDGALPDAGEHGLVLAGGAGASVEIDDLQELQIGGLAGWRYGLSEMNAVAFTGHARGTLEEGELELVSGGGEIEWRRRLAPDPDAALQAALFAGVGYARLGPEVFTSSYPREGLGLSVGGVASMGARGWRVYGGATAEGVVEPGSLGPELTYWSLYLTPALGARRALGGSPWSLGGELSTPLLAGGETREFDGGGVAKIDREAYLLGGLTATRALGR